jgi:hypothetical protein
MTHQWKYLCDTPLTYFSGSEHAGVPKNSQLLLRIVSVSDEGKLTLPARELWCKLETPGDKLNFTISQFHTWDNCDDETDNTLAEANEAISSGLHWLVSQRWSPPGNVAGTGQWYVTKLVKAKPSI